MGAQGLDHQITASTKRTTIVTLLTSPLSVGDGPRSLLGDHALHMAIAAGAEDATEALLMPGGEKPGEAVGMGMDGGKKQKATLARLESRICCLTFF